MASLVLWYTHAAPGVPLLTACGLSLVKRAVLTAGKAGHPQVAIAVHAADEAAVRAELTGDARVQVAWTLHVDPPGLAPMVGTAEELILVFADRVFLKSALDQLGPPLEPVTDARPLCAEDAPGGGLFRLRSQVAMSLTTETLAAGLQALPADARTEALVVTRCWRRVASAADLPAAERLLIQSLTKPADGVVARNINRKISGPISRLLAPHGVHPNMVTAVVCLIGVLSLPFNALGTYAGFVLGGLCYYLSSVLDGVDGELSRLKYLGSPLGAWLDTIVDDIVGTAYLVGLYVGLHRYAGHDGWFWAGTVALVAYFLTVLPRYWLMVTSVGVGDHQAIAAQRLATEKGAFGKAVDFVASTLFRLDFLVFLAFMLSLAGVAWIYAAVFAVGAVMSFIETIYTVATLRRAAT
ncbi:MAG: CDP-alcohol phosphatidyltransferase family protein [Myxococcales bacterium]|nr:CDP-alcohol phosphatidyltransferase family protein [Myxococcales bacterium]MCB9549571.1 CDP-alcohol phosphatidyltransferase family protein [Myxococcales bacterium]